MITVLFQGVNQWSPSKTALSTCETRVLKKNIPKCQKNKAILVKE